MAAGTPVLCSDLAVLREVGGDAAKYAPVGDVGKWADKACSLLEEAIRQNDLWRARRDASRCHAQKLLLG